MIIEGRTSSGFDFSVDSEQLEDFGFLELLADMSDDNNVKRMRAITAMPERLLGKKGRAALLKHVRNERGFTPSAKVVEEINEILTICGSENRDAKNS